MVELVINESGTDPDEDVADLLAVVLAEAV